jgi:hypothetical protein
VTSEWDDETEALAVQVRKSFGDEALMDAVNRAMRSLFSRESPTVVSALDFNVVIKAELRRLVRPN